MSIHVRVKLVGVLKRYAPDPDPTGFAMILPESSHMEDLCQMLGIPLEIVGTAVLNQQKLGGPRELEDGDQILLFPPMVAGG